MAPVNRGSKRNRAVVRTSHVLFDETIIPKIPSCPILFVYGKNKKSRTRYNRLERDVRRVYPYAKKTSELIPLCHNLPISYIDVDSLP
mgnify:CR=1 FL=1